MGIFVPARKNKGIFWFLDRGALYIDVSKIIKIGGDVILVDIKCGDSCAQSTPIGNPPKPKPPCPPPCPPICPPKHNQNSQGLTNLAQNPQETLNLSGIFDQNGNIDLSDY